MDIWDKDDADNSIMVHKTLPFILVEEKYIYRMYKFNSRNDDDFINKKYRWYNMRTINKCREFDPNNLIVNLDGVILTPFSKMNNLKIPSEISDKICKKQINFYALPTELRKIASWFTTHDANDGDYPYFKNGFVVFLIYATLQTKSEKNARNILSKMPTLKSFIQEYYPECELLKEPELIDTCYNEFLLPL